MPTIALMTDFGTNDHYVASIKGVILAINPKVTLVDVSHEIGPQDLFHGAFILRQVMPYFAPQTIFVAVVDPTVGTSRRILAARYSDRVFLAPDNGLLTLIHRDADLQEIRVVENRSLFASQLSNTFHGRDIFAPVAAQLSKGLSLDHVGPVADHIEVLDLARPVHRENGDIEGQVTLIDRFGNLITNISIVDLSSARAGSRQYEVSVASHKVGPVRAAYADVGEGELLAIIGSTQMLEIAVNQGSAAQILGARRGDPVLLK